MAFGTENVQPADGDDLFVFFGDDRFCFCELFLELLFGRLVRVYLEPFQVIASERIGVAAEQNIRTAAGHVGGDRDGAFAAGLSDDLGFLFVIFGVEHFVRNADGF